MKNDIEHLFICLMIICYLLRRNVSSSPSPVFALAFLVVVESSLHILDISLLPNMICKMFFHSVGCVFTLGIVSFDVQKLFYLMRSSCAQIPNLSWKERPDPTHMTFEAN